MAGIPSLTDIDSYNGDRLRAHAAHHEDVSKRFSDEIGKTKAEADNLPWTGAGDEGMRPAIDTMHAQASNHADILTAAAQAARAGAIDLEGQRATILQTVQEAQDDGFQVDEQTWAVTDVKSKTPAQRAARLPEAVGYADMLEEQVGQFVALDAQTGTTLDGHAATLLAGVSAPTGKVSCFGPDGNTYCFEQDGKGGGFTFPGIPAMAGQWPDWPESHRMGSEPPASMMSGGFKQDPLISNPKEPDHPNPIVGPAPGHPKPPKVDEKSLGDQVLDGMIDVVGGTATTAGGAAALLGGGAAEPETGGLSTVAIIGGVGAIGAGTKMVEDGMDKLMHLGDGDGK